MRIRYSRKLAEDLQHSVLKALATHGVVNIPVLDEQVRRMAIMVRNGELALKHLRKGVAA